MQPLFWDASGLIKRYIAENGSDTVNEIFKQRPLSSMMTTPWSYTESYSIIVRRHNEKLLSNQDFGGALTALQTEVLLDVDFRILNVSEDDIFASVLLISKYNMNATDAALLYSLLEYQRRSSESCMLIASDKRLIQAANAESVATLNPQLLRPADVAAALK